MTVPARTEPPQQRNLNIGNEMDDAAARVRRALKQDQEESGWSLDRLAEHLQRDPAQLSRIFDGKGANPPSDLIAWAAKYGPHRRTVAVLNDLSGCTAPRPKPPALPAHWFAAYSEVLDEMGIHEVVRERARARLAKFIAAEEAP